VKYCQRFGISQEGELKAKCKQSNIRQDYLQRKVFSVEGLKKIKGKKILWDSTKMTTFVYCKHVVGNRKRL